MSNFWSIGYAKVDDMMLNEIEKKIQFSDCHPGEYTSKPRPQVFLKSQDSKSQDHIRSCSKFMK